MTERSAWARDVTVRTKEGRGINERRLNGKKRGRKREGILAKGRLGKSILNPSRAKILATALLHNAASCY